MYYEERKTLGWYTIIFILALRDPRTKKTLKLALCVSDRIGKRTVV